MCPERRHPRAAHRLPMAGYAAVYGPPTTIYNRFHRWSQRGIWQGLFAALVEVTPGGIQAIDSTTAKAQRASAGGKGGRKLKRSDAHAADPGPKSME